MKKYNKNIFYELNPRFFKDSSGNGIGDFKGLADKFQYFEHLKIDALILQDALASDGSGKVKSFTQLDKNTGNINDLIKVISYAKKAKIKVLLELNIGTISEDHNWFLSSVDENIEEYKDMVDFLPNKDFLPSENNDTLNLKYSKKRQGYFVEDTKTKEIPLNWNSENVLDKFMEVIRFWTKIGISGFVFKKFEYLQDLSKTVVMNEATLRELRKLHNKIKELSDKIMIVAKSFDISVDESQNYIDGPTKVFDYFLSTRFANIGISKKYGQNKTESFRPSLLVAPLRKFIKSSHNIVSFNANYVGKVLSRWGNDSQYVNESAKSLAMLMFLHTGSVSIYSGDEIGATNIGLTHLDDFQTKDINERLQVALKSKITEKEFYSAQVKLNPINARTLMAWNDTKNGGFSTADHTITPVSHSYRELNVKAEYVNENSILSFYRQIIKIVTNSSYSKTFKQGSIKIRSWIPGLIKYYIVHDNKEIHVYINLSKSVRPIRRPKIGKVVLSSYINHHYGEIPSKLQPYESIMISKVTNESYKETQMLNLAKLKEQENAERERQEQRELQKNEIEKTQAAEEGQREIKHLEQEKARILKEKMIAAQEEQRQEMLIKNKKEEARVKSENNLQKELKEKEEAARLERERKKLLEQKAAEEKKREEERVREEKKAQEHLREKELQRVKEEKRQLDETHQKDFEKEKQLLKSHNSEDSQTVIQKEKELETEQNNQTLEIKHQATVNETTLNWKEKRERKQKTKAERKRALLDEKRHNDLSQESQEHQDKRVVHEMETNGRREKEQTGIVKDEENNFDKGLKNEKDLAKIQREEESHLKHATNLTEDEIAKTTLVDETIDLDDLFDTKKK